MHNNNTNELNASKVNNRNTYRYHIDNICSHIDIMFVGFQCATWKDSCKWTRLTRYCILGLCGYTGDLRNAEIGFSSSILFSR